MSPSKLKVPLDERDGMRRRWLGGTARQAVGAWLKALRFFVPFVVLGGFAHRSDMPDAGISLGWWALTFAPICLIAVYVGAFILSAMAPVPEDHPERYLVGWAVGWVAAVAIFVGAAALVEPTDRSELWFAFILFGTLGAICGPIYGAYVLDWRWRASMAAKQEDKKDGAG